MTAKSLLTSAQTLPVSVTPGKVLDRILLGWLDTPGSAALNGLAIRSPVQEPDVRPATKVSVVGSVLVELEAMLEPDALRESIVARASIRAEANLSLLLATTNLPRPLREACQRSSMRLGPSPPVVGSTFQGDGGGLFGSSVPCDRKSVVWGTSGSVGVAIGG